MCASCPPSTIPPKWKFMEDVAPSKSLSISSIITSSWVVDLHNQMLQPNLSTIVAVDFFHLAIYNTYVIYQKSTERPTAFLKYIEIVTALIYQEAFFLSNIIQKTFYPQNQEEDAKKKSCVCSRGGGRQERHPFSLSPKSLPTSPMHQRLLQTLLHVPKIFFIFNSLPLYIHL